MSKNWDTGRRLVFARLIPLLILFIIVGSWFGWAVLVNPGPRTVDDTQITISEGFFYQINIDIRRETILSAHLSKIDVQNLYLIVTTPIGANNLESKADFINSSDETLGYKLIPANNPVVNLKMNHSQEKKVLLYSDEDGNDTNLQLIVDEPPFSATAEFVLFGFLIGAVTFTITLLFYGQLRLALKYIIGKLKGKEMINEPLSAPDYDKKQMSEEEFEKKVDDVFGKQE